MGPSSSDIIREEAISPNDNTITKHDMPLDQVPASGFILLASALGIDPFDMTLKPHCSTSRGGGEKSG